MKQLIVITVIVVVSGGLFSSNKSADRQCFVAAFQSAFPPQHQLSHHLVVADQRRFGSIPRTASSSSSTVFSTSSTSLNAIAIPVADSPTSIISDVANQKPQQQPLDGPDEWIAKLDYSGFHREVTALGQEMAALGGPADVEHLYEITSWRNVCAFIGIATMWLPPNPITVIALSTWTYASWGMIAHHTCHGGYNRVVSSGHAYHSRGFAIGSLARRCIDWLDWMIPEAWNIEHNRLHHYRLNEYHDPDLVQRNMELIRDGGDLGHVPKIAKYGVVAFFMLFWKWFYYAPNTYKEYQINTVWKQQGRSLPEKFDPLASVTISTLLTPGPAYDAVRQVVPPLDIITKVLGPYFVTRFVLLPLPLLLLSMSMGGAATATSFYTNAMISLVLAEFLTNIHSFITIVTNHAGNDLYTFDDAVKPKSPSFYVRQIVGSANYKTGGNLNDFLHGYLNYQIEHHVWPDYSMRQYQFAAPKLRAICAKYGVPYVQESVWKRLAKTVDIMIGTTSMRVFPTQYEPREDKVIASSSSNTNNKVWKTTHGSIDDDDE